MHPPHLTTRPALVWHPRRLAVSRANFPLRAESSSDWPTVFDETSPSRATCERPERSPSRTPPASGQRGARPVCVASTGPANPRHDVDRVDGADRGARPGVGFGIPVEVEASGARFGTPVEVEASGVDVGSCSEADSSSPIMASGSIIIATINAVALASAAQDSAVSSRVPGRPSFQVESTTCQRPSACWSTSARATKGSTSDPSCVAPPSNRITSPSTWARSGQVLGARQSIDTSCRSSC